MMAVNPAGAMTPKEIMGILRRHLWLIILFTVLGTVLGGASWFLLSRFMPRYTATAQIEVLPPIQQDPTQITATQPQKDIYYQFRFTKAALMTQQNMLQELLRQPAVRETAWYKQFAKVDETGAVAGEAEAFRKAIDNLNRNFRVTAPRDYNFIVVSMRCASAQEAKKIVDTAVSLFLTRQRELARSGISDELAQRIQQRDATQQSLNQFQRSLDAISAGTRFARLNMTGTSTFRDYMDEKLADIERRYSQYESDKGRLESVIATLKRRVEAVEYDEVVREQIEQDPITRQMRANIASMEPLLERQLARFGQEHRAVKETRAALDQMRSDLAFRQGEIAEIFRQSDYRNAQDQMTALTQQLETVTRQLQEAQAEYKQIDEKRIEYAVYDVKKQEQQRLLEEMNSLIEKLNSLYSDPVIHKLRSMGLAAEPLEVSFPRWQLFFPGGFILGLLAGLGLAFAIELLNDLLRTPSDVMRHVRTPLMGMVCHTDDDQDIEDVDLFHVVRQAPYSITSECYRQLRTNLKLAGPDGLKHQTILVTSSSAGDGKTTLAVNLASTLLSENKRVLLLDANFRRPMTGRLFPRAEANGSPAQQADYGLSNYLMGQCTDEKQILRPSGIEGLFLIDSGPLPANPAELLNGDRMKTLLDRCKEQFDYVIIDGPAMLVSDAKTLAAQADGTIVVFNAATTHRGAAMRILRELRDIHANPLGAVLMGVRTRKGGYFGEIYRSYQEYQRVPIQRPV
jgi:capsular exopolysaccharide synthesis family protein